MPHGTRRVRLTPPLVVALFVVTLGVACASNDAGTSVATTQTIAPLESTVPPSTTTSPPTVPATEPVVTTAPTTSVVVDEGFRPPCVESQRADQSAVSSDESSLDKFGPVQVEPVIRVTMPEGVSQYAPEPRTTSVQPVRIPGGVLLNVRAASDGYFPGSILAAIDDDGAARWVRCVADVVTQMYVPPASMSPTIAIVVVDVDQGGDPPIAEYRLVSLVDGSPMGTLAAHLADQGIDAAPDLRAYSPLATTETKLLLGLPDGTIIDVNRDHLLLVDMVDLTAELLPFPQFSNGTDMFYNGFRLDADANPYLIGSEGGKDIVLRAYRDGAWSEGPSTLPPTTAIKVDFDLTPTADRSLALVATDAQGTELWRRDDFVGRMAEGFRLAPSGDITVALGCTGTIDEQNECSKPALAGIRTSNGKTAWMLDGWRGVSAVGDGYALITDFDMEKSETGGGWIVIDTNTGQPVEGQHWADPGTFLQECCGGGEFFSVWRLGGILVAVAERQVAIYYPRGSGLPTRELSLP